MLGYWTVEELAAMKAGWYPDPLDADQWKNQKYPDEAYWNACDIPADRKV